MSTYYQAAYHPPTGTVKEATWIDDYFGHHKYGVEFDGDDKVYTPDEVHIPLGVVFVPEDGLEKEYES